MSSGVSVRTLLYTVHMLCLQVFLSVHCCTLSTCCAFRCFCPYTAVHCPHAVPSGVSVRTLLYTVHMLCLQVFLSVHCCTLSTCWAFRCFCPFTCCTLSTFLCLQVCLSVYLLYTVHMLCFQVFLSVHLLYTVHMLCLQMFMSVQCCTVYTCCVFRCLCTCCILHCPHAVFSGVSVRSPGGPAERRAAGGRCVRRAHGAVGEERAVCRRPHAALVLPHHDRRIAGRQSPRQLQGKAEFRAVGNRPIDHVVGFSPPTPHPHHPLLLCKCWLHSWV